MTFIQAQKISRTTSILIWSAVIFFSLFIITQLLFFRPPVLDNNKVIEAIQDLKKAEVGKRQSETKRDSAYTDLKTRIEEKQLKTDAKINQVDTDLKKVRNDKKITDINSYGSPDLIREFSKIERLYNAAQ